MFYSIISIQLTTDRWIKIPLYWQLTTDEEEVPEVPVGALDTTLKAFALASYAKSSSLLSLSGLKDKKEDKVHDLFDIVVSLK